MSLESDYYANMNRQRNKKDSDKPKKKKKKNSLEDDYYSAKTKLGVEEEDDIAPVRTTTKESKKDVEEEDDEGFDFFQRGALKDGITVGNIAQAILGTAGDVGLGVVKGASKLVGGVIDAGAYGIAGIADAMGNDKFADEMRVRARENVIDDAFEDTDSYLDQYSLLGRTGDAISEGLGQVGAIILTGGLAGGGVLGATAATTGMMGVSSFGSGMTEAYEGGATDEEAAMYGLISGVVNAGSELIFGGLGKAVKAVGISKGLSSLDDMFAQKLASKITSQTAKNFVEFGVKASAEGIEEVLAGIGSAVGKKLTYMEEKELRELVEDENLLEQFVVGAVTSGISQSGIVPGMKNGSLAESNKKGRDFITGMTESDQKVVDRLVENQIAEQEKDGKKLSKKEKDEVYDDIMESLERGEISLDTIAEVVDSEGYKAYQDMVSKEEQTMKELSELYEGDALQKELSDFMANAESQKMRSELDEKVFGLVKNGKLAESYYERGRRGQVYQADLSKYDEKQRAVIERAVNSGVLNNTRRTHEFVDMIAKISADKGVLFDFTSNEKLKGSIYAVDGKTVNGFVTKDGITLNLNSAKALNSVVGHEITHVLEGTKLYDELQTVLFDYAKSKKAVDSNFDSEYKERLYNTRQLYKDIDGYQGVDGFNKIKNEVAADLVGDYLFTDADFVNHLVKNKNVFMRLWDEVKYLYSVSKAGSEEAKKLLEVKRAFEKAYRSNGKNADFADEQMVSPVSEHDYTVIENLLDMKRINNTTANEIIRDESLANAFTKVTGVVLEGTTEQKRSLIRQTVRNHQIKVAEDESVAKETAEALATARAEARAAADEMAKQAHAEQVIRDSGYRSYIRGIFRKGATKADAMEILRNPEMKAEWESVTGKKLPTNQKSAIKMIVQTERNPAKIELPDIDAKYSVSDSDYMDAVNRGDTDKAQMMVDKVARESGYNYRGVHRARAEFTVFDRNKIGSGAGLQFGDGFYISLDIKDKATADYADSAYGKVKMDLYVKMQSPLELGKPISEEVVDRMQQDLVWFGDDDSVKYGVMPETVREQLVSGDSYEQMEAIRWLAQKNVMEISEFMQEYGFDGIISENEYVSQAVVWDENQLKSADPVTYDDSGNVIPLSERFKTENKDIRYSVSDSDGKKLTKEQQEYFKDSKVRDENGNLKVMYHGTERGGFHTFDGRFSDDDISFFFVDSPEVAASYSGSGEVYTAKTFNTTKDMNRFFAEIGYEDYEAVRTGDTFKLYYDADDMIAESDSLRGLYEEFCEYAGVGEGEVNYKVYLNLKNPLAVDAEGNRWNALPGVSDKGKYDYIKIVEVGDAPGQVTIEYAMNGDSAPVTETVDLYQRFPDGLADALSDMAPGESVEDVYANPATTREYAQYAKEQGYDGVVFKNIYDIGAYGSNGATEATVAIAFESNQIKSVANEKPTADKDIRYSVADSNKAKDNVMVLDGGSVAKYSLSTWTPETQNNVRANLIKAGYDADRVDKWIKDANGVAAVIAADKDRLDFEATDNHTMLKDNQEYIKTLDASTLCAKRLLYQGTFDAIQHRMPNTMLSSDDLISLLNMMKEHGVQTPCGVCYVESRRRHLGKFAQEWLNGYKGEYKPNLDEVTTSDGLEALRKSHPDTYEDFINAMNKKGSSNPKVVQLRTEYRNEIMSLTPAQIRKILAIGGLRVQSFSDFETPHLLDMMQAVMDMSAKGLTSQAYTKVPNFAWVFGDTGIKINLSLIAEGDGFDADGNLAFSSVEGMNIDDAMKLRDAYSKNVGTIIVGANDKHILACMADDRIDFIIPFHRSGWGQNELDMMGMTSYTDYSYGQNEHDLSKPAKVVKGVQQYAKVENLYPPDYWDYTLSGKENAERYLNLCAKTGREPKFSQFLVNNGDGSYSLQPDGSTDGYWKTLIDFKMYDNEGNGAAQQKVQPNFNMDEAYRVLNEYEGGANRLPVANAVVDEFVQKHQSGTLRSLSEEGAEHPVYGDYNVYGDDIALAPVPEDAEVSSENAETVAENATVPDVPEEEEIAPVRENPVPPEPPVQEESGRQTRKDLHHGIVEHIRSAFQSKGLDFDEVLKKAKNLSTFATVDNTPQRVMEKALGYKEGQILSDITVNQVAQNETEGIKWLNKQIDTIRQLSEQYGIKPGSKESAAAQMYAEGFYVGEQNDIIEYGDAELAQDFPDANVRANIKRLAGDTRIRQMYDDTLAMINESRVRNLYPEIQKLDNYFLHFRAMDDTFSRLGLPFNPNDIRAKDLPTDLNGVTADLKPGQPFFASAMHRTGKRTSFDLLGGLERYMNSAKNQIYHIDDIQTLRALRNYIADTYGQANGLEGLDELSEEEAQDRINQVFNSHLSTFAKFLNEEANILAGKTALIDRGLEGIIGRRGITFLNELNKQVGSNMVGYNVSSSLTNFLPVVQTFAKGNKAAFVKAFAQTVASKVSGRTDSFLENSPVVIRRKGSDRFYRTAWQRMADPGYAMMSMVDSVSTELIARTKYNELVSKGMDSQKAHLETDKWVSRLMGDRSIGQMPQLYNSRMLGLITKFQLEVRNQLDSQFYDTIQEAKVSNEHIQNEKERNARTAAKVTSTFVQLAVAQHLFGMAFESVAGYNPAFDIIEVLMTAFGFDDEDDSEDTALDNLEQGMLALLEDLPYASTFLDGGRIPIASALPIRELVTGQDEWGNEKSRWDTLKEVAPYYLMPGGYGQLKKTTQGLGMFSDDHPIAGSYTDSGNLRFPVEDTIGNRIKAGVFGQYANDTARDYFDNERSPLKEKQIQEFIDVEMPIRDYWEYREGLSKQEKLEDKFDYIADLDLPVEKKNILINNIVDRKEAVDMTGYEDFSGYEEFDFATKNPEKYDYLQANGISYAEYNASEESREAYSWAFKNPEKATFAKAVCNDVVQYRRYTGELYDIKADKDSDGDSIRGSRKEKVLDWLNNLDADYGTKILLFKSEYEADDTYNRDIVNYLDGRDDLSYEEKATILKELGFTVSNGMVYWD